jgi:hypothetical protein
MSELTHGRVKWVLLLATAFVVTIHPFIAKGWGPEGHDMTGRAAALKMPKETPGFFRKSVERLGYLNNDPDRWRDRVESGLDKAMDQAYAPEHFMDLEEIPDTALEGINRYDYVEQMLKIGKKPTRSGFAAYRTLELFQHLRVQFRLWRTEKDRKKREWIEQRILNDGGILGHYVADLSNPLHTTIHFNGWTGDNPKGYTKYTREQNQGIHYRFEEEYVKSHIQLNDFLPLVSEQVRVLEKPREAIWAYMRDSNRYVEQLYILDKQEPFKTATTSAEHKKFVTERLAAGAEMLRNLWWTAYVTSDPALTPPPAPRAGAEN